MALHIVGPGFSTLVRSVRLYCQERGLEASYGMSVDGRPLVWHSEAHRQMHPFAQVPVLIHGQRHVFETLAICRYLDQAFPSESAALQTQETTSVVEQWASALVSTVDDCLVRQYLLKVAGPRPDKDFSPTALVEAQNKVNVTLAILENQLGDHAFICGQAFSVADALLAPMLDYLKRLPDQGWLSPTPRLVAYLQRLRLRPSGKAVLQAADFSEQQATVPDPLAGRDLP